jgi:Cys-rich protein (TIGR01571 family)
MATYTHNTWKTGLLSCFSSPGCIQINCLGCLCPCVLFGQTVALLPHEWNVEEHSCFGACLGCCLCQAIPFIGFVCSAGRVQNRGRNHHDTREGR